MLHAKPKQAKGEGQQVAGSSEVKKKMEQQLGAGQGQRAHGIGARAGGQQQAWACAGLVVGPPLLGLLRPGPLTCLWTSSWADLGQILNPKKKGFEPNSKKRKINKIQNKR